MKNLQGTRTEANLMAAFAGESQARNKYTYYEAKAKADGYQQIANIFKITAHNEKEHAEIWFKLLHGGSVGATLDNLKDAAAGEHFEWSKMYKDFAQEAQAEGFANIARLFEGVAKIEEEHEARYRALVSNIEQNKVFAKDTAVQWICTNCGHVHEGVSAPAVCPVCQHTQGYFEVRAVNY